MADIGRTFTATDELSMTNPLTAQPKTYKATINVPSSASTRGVILGNYRESDISYLNFEITGAGKPSLVFNCSENGSYVVTRVTFDYDIRGLGWIDLAITHSVTDAVSEFTCYVNGEEIGTQTVDKALTISLASCQRQYRFALGHDWYASGYYFKGAIQNVAIYSNALTADEINDAYINEVDLGAASLMAYYDLTTPENITGTRITDSTANAHDFEPLWQETRLDFDYDYSIAVVGDTQHLVYDDAHKGTQWMAAIYDWLVANKDEKNIKFVMGVGDITHRDGKDDVDNGENMTNVEWEIAVEQLNKAIEAAGKYENADVTADANELMPQVYVSKGNDFLQAKSFPEAEAAYKQALELDATNGMAAFRLGQALASQNKVAEAEAAYVQAAANGQEKNANKQLSNMYVKLAQASNKAKKYEEVIDYSAKSNQYLENANAYRFAAGAYQQLGKNADCITNYEKYLELSPNAKDAAGVKFTIAALYQQAGNKEKAKEYYQAVSTDPQYGASAQEQLKTL